MKLPRWLVVTLLTVSFAVILGTGAWWWVTWPERSARRFEQVMHNNLGRHEKITSATIQSRGLHDWIMGRAELVMQRSIDDPKNSFLLITHTEFRRNEMRTTRLDFEGLEPGGRSILDENAEWHPVPIE